MNDFDEARNAAEEQYDQELSLEEALNEVAAEAAMAEQQEVPAELQEETPAEEAPTETQEDIPVEEKPAVPEISAEEQMIADATQTAEQAAQIAAQKDAELQQIMAQLQAANQANAQLQATIAELSKKNEENILEEALEAPILDIDSLAFADEETKRQAQAEYARQMTDYVKAPIMKELEPIIRQAREGEELKAKNETVAALAQIPELSGIEDMMPQIDRILAQNQVLKDANVPLDQKIVMAYTIAKGVDGINNPPAPPEQPKELSAEELLGLYNSNPEFRELVEKQRVSEIKKSQQVPSFSASSGAGNAALNIPDRPKSFEEALERSRKIYFN